MRNDCAELLASSLKRRSSIDDELPCALQIAQFDFDTAELK